MSYIISRYFKFKEKSDATHLKVSLYYHLGGMNYFTYRSEARGYYISVSPVTRGDGMEKYVAFSGYKKCIMEVARKSAKAEKRAVGIYNEKLEGILADNGLTLADETRV